MWPHTTELLLVLAIAVLLFGAGRIPKLAEDLGKSIKAFKKGLKDEDTKTQEEDDKK
ncbi:MAG: twin-arginine translocase TatA/TatE family subunit [Alphaproteobacteria bacterium]